LIKECPVNNLLMDRGYVTCMSDCAATNKPEYCCTGEFEAHGKCAPSNQFLAKACPGAYAWPHDDGGGE
jgi:hypothetical protein